MYAASFNQSKRAALIKAGCLILIIALVDWRIVGQIPLGFLYLAPMLLVGGALGPWPIAGVATLCTVLAEVFDDIPWSLHNGISRDLLYFTAFLGAGLFVRETSNNRRVTLQHLDEIERQSSARFDAEEQLKALIESSPAAVLAADSDGLVLMANEAAHRMLGMPQGELRGKWIHRYFPSLANVCRHQVGQHFRSVMQANGLRDDGEAFLADICFSTYHTQAGPRLTAMVLDSSEELRTHEVSGLHQLLSGSRIAVGAVSHEVRNISGAMAAIHQNLTGNILIPDSRDFDALGSLITALQGIANINLQQSATRLTEIDLKPLLEELRIVVAPMLQAEGIEASWAPAADLPAVWADRSSLMQVFLNLITNSMRALSRRGRRVISIAASTDGNQVLLEFSDTGGGVLHPERLFRPFQSGAEATGLGLYLSRAFLRSFGGELSYRALPGGACFVINLVAVPPLGQE